MFILYRKVPATTAGTLSNMVLGRYLEILTVATATATETIRATETVRATETTEEREKVKTVKAAKAAKAPKATKAASATGTATKSTDLRNLITVWVPINRLSRIEIANIQRLEFVIELIHSCHPQINYQGVL